MSAAFTVSTIAREPWPVLNRFLSWHLAQGAERIILYLDDPDDCKTPIYVRHVTEEKKKHITESIHKDKDYKQFEDALSEKFILSCEAEPFIFAYSNPAPISTPLTDGMPIR